MANKKAKAKPAVATEAVGSVQFPIVEVHAGYASRAVEVQRLLPRQAAAMKFLWCSLKKAGECCQGGRSSHPDGTSVDSQADGLRWLLDRIADQIESETSLDLTEDFGLSFR